MNRPVRAVVLMGVPVDRFGDGALIGEIPDENGQTRFGKVKPCD
jgi:hypothetical protein